MGALHKLSNSGLKSAPVGKHCDGGGLWFIKRPDGGGQWVYRFTLHGKRPEMGLGSWPVVSLADARKNVAQWRKCVAEGISPIRERQRLKAEAAKSRPTLTEMVAHTFDAKRAELVGGGTAGRWDSPLRLHVVPKIGHIPIEDVTQHDLKSALAPIWHTKSETARKAMNRIGLVFKYAAAAGYDVDMQATAKAKALLGKHDNRATPTPHVPWQEVASFYASLTSPTSIHLCLRLLILTGLRSGSVRRLRYEYIEGDILTVPAQDMKGTKQNKKEFRLPLSKAALAVIEETKAGQRDGYLFPSPRKGFINDTAMINYMKRLGMVARPHGFRSTFKTWCDDNTDFADKIVETQISHKVGSAVERAYRRTDFFEKRRAVMEVWANHVTGVTDM